MKIQKYINTFAIALPFIIFLSAIIFGESAIALALLSTMITGFLQVSISIIMFVDNPRDRDLNLYLGGVICFFGVWLINHLIGYNNFLTYILFPTPLILAIYMSTIIYKE